MIINFEIDQDELTSAIVASIEESYKSEICDIVADNIDASDIAECVSTYDISREIDMDDLFSNIEIDYAELADHIIDARNFKTDIASIMWQQFSDDFGAAMKCVREEIALMNVDIERLSLPFWRRWFNLADKEEVAAS